MADAMDWIYIPHQLDKNTNASTNNRGFIVIYIPHQLDKNDVRPAEAGIRVSDLHSSSVR